MHHTLYAYLGPVHENYTATQTASSATDLGHWSCANQLQDCGRKYTVTILLIFKIKSHFNKKKKMKTLANYYLKICNMIDMVVKKYIKKRYC